MARAASDGLALGTGLGLDLGTGLGLALGAGLGLALGAGPAPWGAELLGAAGWCLSAGVGRLWSPALAGVHMQAGRSCTCETAHTCNKSTFTPAQNAAIGSFPSPASVSNFRTCSHFCAGLPLLFFSPLS